MRAVFLKTMFLTVVLVQEDHCSSKKKMKKKRQKHFLCLEREKCFYIFGGSRRAHGETQNRHSTQTSITSVKLQFTLVCLYVF